MMKMLDAKCRVRLRCSSSSCRNVDVVLECMRAFVEDLLNKTHGPRFSVILIIIVLSAGHISSMRTHIVARGHI
jgi:hypothetical protein